MEKVRKFLLIGAIISFGILYLFNSDVGARGPTIDLDPISNVNVEDEIEVTGSISWPITWSRNVSDRITFSGSGAGDLKDSDITQDGMFSTNGRAPKIPGNWEVQASFKDFPDIKSNTQTYETVAVDSRIGTTLILESISDVNVDEYVTVTGSLRESDIDDPISGARITFDGSGARNLDDSVTTQDDGSFSADGRAPTRVGDWSVQAHFSGNSNYDGDDSNNENYQTLDPSIVVSPPVLPPVPIPPPLSPQTWGILVLVILIALALIAYVKHKRSRHKVPGAVTIEVDGGVDDK